MTVNVPFNMYRVGLHLVLV